METSASGSETWRDGLITTEPTALLVNTASRTGEEKYVEVHAYLTNLGVPLVHSQAVNDPDTLTQVIRAAVEGGARRVIVGGGDGTLSAAASVLAGQDVRMGVLPLGTCNDFARSLHIPEALDAACRIVAGNEVRSIDVGRANDRMFLNAASIGLSSAVTRRITDDLKRKFGRGAFAFAAASEVWRHRPFKVSLDVDGRELHLDAQQVVIGNGRYHGGGHLVAPDATHEDRHLDIYVIRSSQIAQPDADEDDPHPGRLQDIWNLLRIAVLLRKGRHLNHPAVTYVRARRVRVEADPPQEVDVDGELAGHSPVSFEVTPAALQVLVPARTQ